MLKGISPILSPDLLKILREMGHGDTIVLADGNFPGASLAQRLVRLDGHGCVPVLEAILRLMPLDSYVEEPVKLMAVTPGDPVETPIWDEYRSVVAAHEPDKKIGFAERFEFYDLAKQAYCVVQTGEKALYANLILKKGVVCE